MKRTTVIAGAGIGVAALALVVAIMFSLGASTELANMRQGIDEGYELRGTYYTGEDRIVFLSFYEEDGRKQWQHSDAQGGITEGLYEETGDPNLYLMLDADGREIGWAHLAYANGKGEGTLFYTLGSDEVAKMRKDARNPRTAEPSAG